MPAKDIVKADFSPRESIEAQASCVLGRIESRRRVRRWSQSRAARLTLESVLGIAFEGGIDPVFERCAQFGKGANRSARRTGEIVVRCRGSDD